MIQLTDITLNFGARALYANLNWQVPDRARVALIGNNGAGKTTLFRILLGEIEPDSGYVVVPKRTNISYLAQDLSEGLAPDVSLAELFDTEKGHEPASRAGKVLKGLGFLTNSHISDVLRRKVSEFSGGWKMRLQLARVLLSLGGSEDDVLLLDEPTNHLDTESMEWLESWLGSFQGTIVAIAHDRRFLDKLFPVTAELSSGRITLWKGNYSYYIEESAKRREILLAQAKQQASEMEKTRLFIEKFRYKATKAAQVQSRIKALEKVELIEVEEAPPEASFRFPEAKQGGYEVVKVEDVSKIYDPLTVFSDVSFSVIRGQKIALVGANGSGKSTLSRLISGIEQPSGGKITLGHNVQCSYYLQESVQNLDYSKTIMEEISQTGKIDAAQKRDLLGAFLFRGDDIYKRIGVLSGGEKSRLALLKILLQDSNFLILDEPTNHLDASTRGIFERALLQYSGTVLLVSHDRHFLDSLADRVLEIRDGRIWDYPGNYSYFIYKRELRLNEQEKGVKEELTKTEAKQRKKERNARLYAEESEKILFRRELKSVELKINVHEEEIKNCDKMLCDPEILSDSSKIRELMLKRNAAANELESLLPEWEQLMGKIN
ncbi:MAG: ATP-binding cassette domain-containing protein [Synergistaceae bacterium]|nr:ATP-binding cassette domain-containing protein [Synergistaceae bacterium]